MRGGGDGQAHIHVAVLAALYDARMAVSYHWGYVGG